MRLFWERLSYFRVKHLTSSSQPYLYTQKLANIFDRIQDLSRLGLENKSCRIFLRSTGLLYKFLPTNLGVFKYGKKEQNLSEICKNKTTPHGTVYLRCDV